MKIKKIIAAVCAAAAVLNLAGCSMLDSVNNNSGSNRASSVVPASSRQIVNKPNSANVGETYKVEIHINFESNMIFSKYDVDISVDGVKQETLKHGTDADFGFDLAAGEHTIMFTNHDDSSVSGSVLLNVADDMKAIYKISCHYDRVEVDEENGGSANDSSVFSNDNSIPSDIVSTPTVTDETLTVVNCPELQSLIFLDREVDEAEIKAFAEKYDGKTIELEMLTTFVEKNKKYKTRFNYLLYAVKDGSVMMAGPAFMFEDVNYYDLHLTGDNVPDSFGTGIHCLVKAEIEGYDSTNKWTLLDPVSIEVIKDYNDSTN